MQVTKKLANLIDGELRAPAGGAYLDVFEPATGKVHARCPDSDARDVAAAVDAARAQVVTNQHLDALYQQALTAATRNYCN